MSPAERDLPWAASADMQNHLLATHKAIFRWACLRRITVSINMRGMRFSRSTRKIVALLAAVLLLLCQTAGAAYGCLTSPAQEHDASAVTALCHTATEDGESAPRQPAAASSCDASQA